MSEGFSGTQRAVTVSAQPLVADVESSTGCDSFKGAVKYRQVLKHTIAATIADTRNIGDQKPDRVNQ